MSGLFVTFEGPDGCGKSTIVNLIYEKLKDDYELVKTREPGGTEISEKIRDLILDNDNYNMSYRTEALLYAASRAQHVEEKILPSLRENKIVLCERFTLSSIVYQGYARGLNIEDIEMINRFATGGFTADVTFLFDTKNLETVKRKQDEQADRIENSSSDFHNKVKLAYKDLIDSGKYTVINASQDIDHVLNDCLSVLYNKLEEKK
jgi:dTMP kinase